MTIPFHPGAREYRDLGAGVRQAIEEVLASGEVLQGPPVARLEARLAAATGRAHGVAVNSCTDALSFALESLGVGPGDEVLVPDLSFVASASCIVRCGATPVFVDIDPRTLHMDLEAAERLVTGRTRALISVDLYGQMPDPATVETFARAHGLLVVEDAAQAIGARFDGRPAGSVGHVSCLSFDPFKTVAAPGSGGMVLTDDQEAADRVRRLRYHGRSGDGLSETLGFNSQMPALVAAVLELKLGRDAEWTERRHRIAGRYSEALRDVDHLTAPEVAPGAEHVFQKYVVRSPQRDALRGYLAERGIESRIHYPVPLHRHPVFASSPVEAPNAEEASATVLSLPIHASLEDEEIEAVADALASFARQPVSG